ncbi:ABC transporter substrate-binding protein [Compostimonas suwonensis]|uniref:Multiple sugar transport system substrate-binding protein n=1 Tax=Compostimonas suwonensis TaxID=1048394 RepID=A0A2M9BVL8_9MICO|nr:extracellular solute-binding protein [Compostimonas suwonensis]PJJ61992.1 multiple sugar transport system substrate-binding protein [Compostimonas suwonensis]
MRKSTTRTVARYASAFTLAGAMVALAGCSAAPVAEAGDPMTMYAWISGDTEREQWQSFVDLARADDPDLPEITLEGPSFSDYMTKVKTRLAGGDTVCIVTTQATGAESLKDVLLPLDDLIESSGTDLSDFNQSMLDGMTVDGDLLALPYDAEPLTLFYNKDQFRDAGLALPGTTYTREQFRSDAQALTTPDRFGFAMAPGLSVPNAWALADGVPAVKDGELDITSPEFVEQLQSYFDLAAVDGVARAPEAADASEVSQQAFINGDTSMLIEGPWWYTPFQEQAKFDLGITVVPSTSGEARGMTAGSGFGIAKMCDRPEEALQVILGMTSEKAQLAQASARGIVPARASALPAWAEGKNEGASDVINALLGNATAQLTTPNWSQVETLMSQYGVEGYRGEQTAEEITTTISNSVGR